MSEQADFITILSSEMIADIVEEHFNKKVYKQRVKVIDTKATEAGYMFSLMIVAQSPQQITQKADPLYNPMLLSNGEVIYNKNEHRTGDNGTKKPSTLKKKVKV